MSTSDAVLEIKDRAETVQGQTWEAPVPALLLLLCNLSPRTGSCWGPAMSHITSHGPPKPLLHPHQDWLSHPVGTWLLRG